MGCVALLGGLFWGNSWKQKQIPVTNAMCWRHPSRWARKLGARFPGALLGICHPPRAHAKKHRQLLVGDISGSPSRRSGFRFHACDRIARLALHKQLQCFVHSRDLPTAELRCKHAVSCWCDWQGMRNGMTPRKTIPYGFLLGNPQVHSLIHWASAS